MELLIFDESMTPVTILETFSSLIWTDRYFECGDFEIYMTATNDILNLIQQGYYAQITDSKRTMIVEEILIETDIECGNNLTIRGRSLESILDRRIVWTQTILDGNAQNAIKKILMENVIAPSDPDRIIPNFIFEESKDPIITGVSVRAQFTGDTVYDAVHSICEAAQIGFRVVYDDANRFVFSLFAGRDRSFAQLEYPYVVFSPSFENIISSNYLESQKAMKTIALVAGEGEGSERKTVTIGGKETGLARRELFVDARDVSSVTTDGTLSMEEYIFQMEQRGRSKLTENAYITSFEGEIEINKPFSYGTDFFIGDILQITNEYGISARVRLTELVISVGVDGKKTHPTLVGVV